MREIIIVDQNNAPISFHLNEENRQLDMQVDDLLIVLEHEEADKLINWFGSL